MNLKKLADSRSRIKDSELKRIKETKQGAYDYIAVSSKDLINLAKCLDAYDVTNMPYEEMRNFRSGRNTIAVSRGTYGVNGVLFEKGGEFYVVTARNSNAQMVL